jgi:hypothetical protein
MGGNHGNKNEHENRRKHETEAGHGRTPVWRVWREDDYTELRIKIQGIAREREKC